ncbi:hypothetical protein LJC74_08470 [Eubacteriales bacterium OttesenSCG-928-A19]|nr:hypothetical protein [Eubacteriales bacterium OttesenSCG-928-A19]
MKKNSIGYTIDHTKKTIIITKAFAKKANTDGTQEFNTLVELMDKLRGYKVVEKTIKKSASKKTYSGLTTKLMKDYIIATRDEEEAKRLLVEMAETAKMGEFHGAKYCYVRGWFFKVCPEFKETKAEEAETDTTQSESKAA